MRSFTKTVQMKRKLVQFTYKKNFFFEFSPSEICLQSLNQMLKRVYALLEKKKKKSTQSLHVPFLSLVCMLRVAALIISDLKVKTIRLVAMGQ